VRSDSFFRNSQRPKTGRANKLPVMFRDAFAAIEMQTTRTAAHGFALRMKIAADLT
jgi:hypothetical protein